MRLIALLIVGCLFSLNNLFAADENPLWMRYPAISPDGNTIVFSYKGDLYRVNASGGTATPLTLHEAHDYLPVWSADGSKIAFASERHGNFDVFSIPAVGGSATRLTFHSSHDYPSAFSPDGSRVFFSSARLIPQASTDFPSRGFPQLHSISLQGGMPKMELGNFLENARPDKKGTRIIYQDVKGLEDDWRKHHVSSVTRDIWLYDKNKDTHTQLTTFEGEDRNPMWSADESEIFYLSEKSGTFNVWKLSLNNPSQPVSVTAYNDHPVRFLSVSDAGVLCYGYRGEIYTLQTGQQPRKVAITMAIDEKYNSTKVEVMASGATEMDISPNGKEVVFVVRGEVFVTAVENGLTKRITNTPEQERSVSFSPDGRKILYAGERNGSWNLYETEMVREEEPYFYISTLLKEKEILVTPEETFQPAYSPDGKEVAYLEERTTLKVLNLENKKSRTILPADKNYSYSDGDQWYDWSPDGKWFLVTFIDRGRWMNEVGLVSADGGSPVINLTNSGYADAAPKWMMNGEMMIWFNDSRGMRSHGSWGSQDDVFGMFFTKDAWDKFRLSKEDYEIEKLKEEANPEKDKKKEGDKTKPWIITPELADPIQPDLANIEDRIARLTIHSSSLSDAVLSPDGTKLYYLSSFEKGHDLWMHDLKEDETRIITKLDERGGSLLMDAKGKTLFVLNSGKIYKIDTDKKDKTPVGFKAEMTLNLPEERAYMFEHMWRQVLKKFYVTDLHGVKWQELKSEYSRFLSHINNNHDFSEMMSELLGELNGSHTGCFYRSNDPGGNQTASLGIFYDQNHTGVGIKITEVIEKGPLELAEAGIKAGQVIEKIDGTEIAAGANFFPLLNRKAGTHTLLSMYDPENKKRWEVTVKPITGRAESELLYQRWVKTRRAETEKQSGGKVGYVHVRGMDDESFREVYSDVLGRYADKDALIVDTRFNGGGWLHDDLATFLSGKLYVTLEPRGQKIGSEPLGKWTKPSTVLVGEGNYSDAHFFPYVYKELGIGKLIGMPVPGTATAVWWERQIDPSLTFGIPQVGVKGLDGKYLENQQLIPDFQVKNEPGPAQKGRDQQLEKAVEHMLEEAQKPELER
ncbi:MAG: S41 family peptidase [Bacteroidia bacterium]|nr:S41 family peptidase [Bacteroidia bacterium]